MKIVGKTSQANEAVIQIRDIRNQIEESLAGIDDAGLDKAAKNILDQMAIVEQDLYQVKNVSHQDPLNFPIKLNNRLASLRRSIENGDARPTDGAYQVFEELSKELEGHMAKLKKILSTDLPQFNKELEAKNGTMIEIGEQR